MNVSDRLPWHAKDMLLGQVEQGMKPAQDSGRTLNENNCDEWYIILHLLYLTHNVMQMLVLLPWGTCICSGQRLRVDLNSKQWEAIHGEEGEQIKVSKTYRAIKYDTFDKR